VAVRGVLDDVLSRSDKNERAEFRVRHVDGSWRQVETICRNLMEEPAVSGLVLNARDITERKQAEEALRHQALHDELTGLPNRTLLQDRLSQAILAARRDNTPLTLLLVDLDRFKEIGVVKLSRATTRCCGVSAPPEYYRLWFFAST
jgi:PleD family two-component response regulator